MKLRGILLALLCAPALAGTTPWTLEPTTIFGIELGKPFPNSNVVGDCPTFAPFRREPQSEELCVDTRQEFGAERIAVRNVPLTEGIEAASVHLHAGLVRAIVVEFETKRYEALRALLVERYGEPHARVAAADSETLTWTGARIAIVLQHAADAGRVEFRTAH